MKSLYAYYGLIDLHDIDSPGHSLYQIGLIDSISETFKVDKFDFYSYYPDDIVESAKIEGFPSTELGKIFHQYRTKLLDIPVHSIHELLKRIEKKEYDTLFLKARFRNLSALAKKWKDAWEFEEIIKTAVSSGYSKEKIVILDTDLSLSPKVIEQLEKVATILVPSIDFPGISLPFLMDCVRSNVQNWENRKKVGSVFYGNIDTSNYKAGNEKSSILGTVINWVSQWHSTANDPFYLICKANDFNSAFPDQGPNLYHIDRSLRTLIWGTLENSSIMLNVTKEKYNHNKFIPARVFEAMIFGLIPVSYKFDFLCPAFSFETVDDLSEIYKYFFEMEPSQLNHAYEHFVNHYVKYALNNKPDTQFYQRG